MALDFIPGPSSQHAVLAQSVQVISDRSIAIAAAGHVVVASRHGVA
jgi:hypothetical protein